MHSVLAKGPRRSLPRTQFREQELGLWWPLSPHPHIPVDMAGRSEAPQPFHCWSGRPLGESSCGYPTLGFLETPVSRSGSQVLSSAFECMKVWQTDVGRAVLLPRGAGLLAWQCWHCWQWLTLSSSEWHSLTTEWMRRKPSHSNWDLSRTLNQQLSLLDI